ncbi:hypothetical protein D3C73_1208700 [compost metagenome]
MDEKLFDRFIDQFGAATGLTIGSKEQCHHVKRVVPKLIVIDLVGDVMRKGAFSRAAHFGDGTVRPRIQHRLPARIAGLAPENRKAQHRRCRVDVQLRQTSLDAGGIPVLYQNFEVVAAGELPHPDQAIKPDALRPFPAVEGNVIAGRTVEIGFVKAPVIAQAGHAGDEQIEFFTDMPG